MISFISVLNSFELSITPTYLYPINKLKYLYNLPDDRESKRLTNYSRFILSAPKYTREDIGPYSFTIPPGGNENICSLERELLFVYLDNGHKEI